MLFRGTEIQRIGHGKCGHPSISFLTTHPVELSTRLILGPVGPTMSFHRDTLPHVQSVAWQGGMYVRSL